MLHFILLRKVYSRQEHYIFNCLCINKRRTRISWQIKSKVGRLWIFACVVDETTVEPEVSPVKLKFARNGLGLDSKFIRPQPITILHTITPIIQLQIRFLQVHMAIINYCGIALICAEVSIKLISKETLRVGFGKTTNVRISVGTSMDNGLKNIYIGIVSTIIYLPLYTEQLPSLVGEMIYLGRCHLFCLYIHVSQCLICSHGNKTHKQHTISRYCTRLDGCEKLLFIYGYILCHWCYGHHNKSSYVSYI